MFLPQPTAFAVVEANPKNRAISVIRLPREIDGITAQAFHWGLLCEIDEVRAQCISPGCQKKEKRIKS